MHADFVANTVTPGSGGARSCPSYFCKPGVTVLGIVLPSGKVAFASDRIEPFVVDEAFARDAMDAGNPESKFRFAGPCIRGGCRQWTGHACGLAQRLMDEARAARAFEGPSPVDASSLPSCIIRGSCRWRHEHGDAACVVCPWVAYVLDESEPQSRGLA